jgi:hypothetical protein
VLLDYVDASNIADKNYCGVERVLQVGQTLDRSPLLCFKPNSRQVPQSIMVSLYARMRVLASAACNQFVAFECNTFPPSHCPAVTRCAGLGPAAEPRQPASHPGDAVHELAGGDARAGLLQ